MARPFSPGTRSLAALLGALALGALFAIGCGKKKGDASPEPEASASEPSDEHSAHDEASSAPSASESATHATTAPTHGESTDAGGESDGAVAAASSSGGGLIVNSAAMPSPTVAAPHASTSASIAAGTCGEKGQPKCPLQGWMSTVLQPALASKDAAKLAAALRQCAKYAPPGFPEWAKIANEGATAVDRATAVTAGKKSCTDCHNLYKAKYKSETRARSL